MDDFFNLSDISAQNEELNDSMKLLDKINGQDNEPEEEPPE